MCFLGGFLQGRGGGRPPNPVKAQLAEHLAPLPCGQAGVAALPGRWVSARLCVRGTAPCRDRDAQARGEKRIRKTPQEIPFKVKVQGLRIQLLSTVVPKQTKKTRSDHLWSP